MAKQTIEQFICDICQEVGERYTLSFPDGIKVLDRCSKHDKKIMDLKEEVGDWTSLTSRPSVRRGQLELTDPATITRKRTRKKP